MFDCWTLDWELRHRSLYILLGFPSTPHQVTETIRILFSHFEILLHSESWIVDPATSGLASEFVAQAAWAPRWANAILHSPLWHLVSISRVFSYDGEDQQCQQRNPWFRGGSSSCPWWVSMRISLKRPIPSIYATSNMVYYMLLLLVVVFCLGNCNIGRCLQGRVVSLRQWKRGSERTGFRMFVFAHPKIFWNLLLGFLLNFSTCNLPAIHIYPPAIVRFISCNSTCMFLCSACEAPTASSSIIFESVSTPSNISPNLSGAGLKTAVMKCLNLPSVYHFMARTMNRKTFA